MGVHTLLPSLLPPLLLLLRMVVVVVAVVGVDARYQGRKTIACPCEEEEKVVECITPDGDVNPYFGHTRVGGKGEGGGGSGGGGWYPTHRPRNCVLLPDFAFHLLAIHCIYMYIQFM